MGDPNCERCTSTNHRLRCQREAEHADPHQFDGIAWPTAEDDAHRGPDPRDTTIATLQAEVERLTSDLRDVSASGMAEIAGLRAEVDTHRTRANEAEARLATVGRALRRLHRITVNHWRCGDFGDAEDVVDIPAWLTEALALVE